MKRSRKPALPWSARRLVAVSACALLLGFPACGDPAPAETPGANGGGKAGTPSTAGASASAAFRERARPRFTSVADGDAWQVFVAVDLDAPERDRIAGIRLLDASGRELGDLPIREATATSLIGPLMASFRLDRRIVSVTAEIRDRDGNRWTEAWQLAE